ncbi:hypothetical protein ATW55_10440 [Ferroacidibacillus organovorans]|uniref:Cytochrome c biogenesis protein CcdC n=1 Tax=Ferroacidibacillus organovorans TaxID=1765683 RepID=A0A101XNZ2_9BACL|nr:hypothetical protein ATW55_10440 [Ferroacidibacillus organovorans]
MCVLSGQAAQWISTIVIIAFALSVIVIRLRAARKPTNAKKILIPPLGMSTGFLMFVTPLTRVPLTYALAALLVGVLFSIPLIASSKLERHGGQVYLKRSPAFIVVLLVLLVIRIALHGYIEKYITIPQTGGIFFILAFGMLLPWRIVMYMKYKRFLKSFEATPELRESNA